MAFLTLPHKFFYEKKTKHKIPYPRKRMEDDEVAAKIFVIATDLR